MYVIMILHCLSVVDVYVCVRVYAHSEWVRPCFAPTNVRIATDRRLPRKRKCNAGEIVHSVCSFMGLCPCKCWQATVDYANVTKRTIATISVASCSASAAVTENHKLSHSIHLATHRISSRNWLIRRKEPHVPLDVKSAFKCAKQKRKQRSIQIEQNAKQCSK